MTTSTATFSTGKTITRNSKAGRSYPYAWATKNKDGVILQAGFAGTQQAADRSARSYLKFTYHVDFEVVKAVQS